MKTFEPRSVEPEDAGLLDGGLDVRGEALQLLGQQRDGAIDLCLRNDGRAQTRGERQSRGIAHPRQDPERAGPLVDPENFALRPVAVDHRDGVVPPVGMAQQEQLERKDRQVNAGHPAHGRSPYASTPAPDACP